jgi:DNA-binding HxlR family transcriptional regulator
LIIGNEKLRQAVLAALADKESLKILNATMFRPKAINDIIRETEIPHTTAYRKVNSMLEQGLLVVEKTKITPDGKKYSEVRSTLRSFKAKYELGELVVEGEQNYSPIESAAENFFSVDT